MKLYFVRHTTAADVAPSDAQRPLTRQGEEEARIVGAALAGLSVRPGRIFSSPLLRARQTAAIIGKELKFASTTEAIEELNNGESTPSLLRALPVVSEIVLVGHMPSLAEHIAEMIGTPPSTGLALGKGSVACVELRGASGNLQWLKHLQQLAPTG
jgi:phosphohistidine phosphatase